MTSPLFITRSFPPSVGGMERFSYSLAKELKRLSDAQVIANRWGRRSIPAFLPYAMMAALVMSRKDRVSVVHLGDALLAPQGVVIKQLTGLPVTVTVHGLDLTFENAPYQAAIGRTIGRLDRIIAVSESTRDICIERWPETASRVVVVPNGVDAPGEQGTRSDLATSIEARLRGKRVLLTVGRLVERKGVRWFVQQVLNRLDKEVVYVVAGDGPEAMAIRTAAADAGVEDRLVLLGRVPDETLEALYARADVFVMPNVVIPGDVEGFGLVALEAAVRGLPVVAADLQGIPEAIHDGSNGFLVRAGDAEAFAERIASILGLGTGEDQSLRTRMRTHTLEMFSWENTARTYLRQFEEVCEERLAA